MTLQRLLPRTIRWRLTAVLAVVMAALLVTLITAQYLLLRGFLYQRVEATAGDAGKLVLQRHAPPRGGPKGSAPPPTPLEPGAGAILQDLAASGYEGEVIDRSGAIVAQTQGSEGSTPPAMPGLQPLRDLSALGGGGQANYDTSFQGRRFTIVDLAIREDAGSQPTGVLRIVASLSDADATLSNLLALDGITLAAGLVVVLLVAPWLAGLSLRPLGQMASIATAVGHGDWTRRERLPRGDDEVGRVGEALRSMIAEIQEKVDAQQRFVADASHELQTPLTTFRSTLELLLLEVDRTPQERLQLLANLRRETLRMSRLVDDLLALARSSDRPLRMAPATLATAVDDAVEELGQALAGRVVSFDLDRELRVTGEADSLRRIARNLLENAATFTSEGGHIIVTARRAGAHAELSVADDGIGIAPEHLPHIFDRLYRADPSRWRGRGGAGLGLAIVQAAVSAHGGSVRVESEPGKGSTFTVCLPLLPDKTTLQAGIERTVGEGASAATDRAAPEDQSKPT